jgi:hypothetical protein
MNTCEHKRAHIINCVIVNLRDTTGFMADVKIRCADCNMPFRFRGLPAGASTTVPMVSVLGDEARLPIEPLDMDGPLRPGLQDLLVKPPTTPPAQ